MVLCTTFAACSKPFGPPLAPATLETFPAKRPQSRQLFFPSWLAEFDAPALLVVDAAKLSANQLRARQGAAASPSGATCEHLRVLLGDEDCCNLIFFPHPLPELFHLLDKSQSMRHSVWLVQMCLLKLRPDGLTARRAHLPLALWRARCAIRGGHALGGTTPPPLSRNDIPESWRAYWPRSGRPKRIVEFAVGWL